MENNEKMFVASLVAAAREADRAAQGALVRPVAPEDLAPGMYITVMLQRYEWWPSGFCEPSPIMLDRYPLRWDRAPEDSGVPLRVVGVCLPFALTETPAGVLRTVDTRSMSVARFNPVYGREAFARLARQAKGKSAAAGTGGDDDDDTSSIPGVED